MSRGLLDWWGSWLGCGCELRIRGSNEGSLEGMEVLFGRGWLDGGCGSLFPDVGLIFCYHRSQGGKVFQRRKDRYGLFFLW